MSIVCCREKAVLVAVYAERPRRRLTPSPGKRSHQHHHHHHHHIHVLHNTVDPNKTTASRGRGYDRRADLLEYARHLRASARPTTLTASTSARRSTSVKRSRSVPHVKQSPSVQIVPAKPKERTSSPTCFGKWECLMPGFLRTLTASKITKDRQGNKVRKSLPGVANMKVMVKSLVVQKKGNFMAKTIGKLRKRA